MTPARADRRRRLLADPTIRPHGLGNTYREWGCRCSDCTLANTIAERVRTTGRSDVMSEEDRFWSRVEKGPSCWVVRGADSYGEVTFGARSQRAHRVAWLLAKGPVPVGLCVCHRCDNPPCVRPDHLFLGTQADNMRDMREKGRGNIGSRNGISKLTEAQVRSARQRRQEGERQDDIAFSLGVSPSTLSMALNGKTWRHVR